MQRLVTGVRPAEVASSLLCGAWARRARCTCWAAWAAWAAWGLQPDTYRNTRSALHRQGSIAGQSPTAFSKCFVRFGEMSDLGPLKGLPGPF